MNLVEGAGLLVATTTSSVAGAVYLWRGIMNLRPVLYASTAMSVRAFLGARLGLYLAVVTGAQVAEIGSGILLSM